MITGASLRAPGAAPPPAMGGPPGQSTSLPEHCEVTGHLRERTGIDGQRYSIQFHMRLPTSWNGRALRRFELPFFLPFFLLASCVTLLLPFFF